MLIIACMENKEFMMKRWILLAFILILFSCERNEKNDNNILGLESRQEIEALAIDEADLISFPKVLYVDSEIGLRVRLEPSVDSEIITTFRHGERIVVFGKNHIPMTINGIIDHWYEVRGIIGGEWRTSAWVFGGFLSKELPKDAPVIIGIWDVEFNNRNHLNAENHEIRFSFSADETYFEGIRNTGGLIRGTWSLNGNELILINENEVETKISITINDRNNLSLHYLSDEGIIILNRSRELW